MKLAATAHNLAKVEVASSSLVSRSMTSVEAKSGIRRRNRIGAPAPGVSDLEIV